MEIIGHKQTLKQLETAMLAAQKRNVALPHTLLAGAPGCGKTSMARYIASQLNVSFLSVVPNDLNSYENVIKVLNKLNHDNYDEYGNRIGIVHPTVLFLDEIHNLPLKGQELLGLVMERFIIESGITNKFHWVPYFSLIGATTIAGKLSKPFFDRFKLNFVFQPYPIEDMYEIVKYHAKVLKVKILPEAVLSIAIRSRGTPRTAVGYIERVRDRMLVYDSIIATKHLVEEVFLEMGIDKKGFTQTDLKMLKALFDAGGKPVSLDNLGIITEEDTKTIRQSVEPFLIKKGLILVSGKGRILTEKGLEYIENSGKIDKPVKKEIAFDYERI